jgi:DNA polymerase-3 subunit alpha
MAVITLDDRTGRMEAVVYAEAYQRFREVLVKDKLVVAEGEVSADDFTGRYSMIVRHLYDLNRARQRFAKHVVIRVAAQRLENGFVQQLADVLEPFRQGPTPVCIDYQRSDAAVRLALGEAWRVYPNEELLTRLQTLAGKEHVHLVYTRVSSFKVPEDTMTRHSLGTA